MTAFTTTAIPTALATDKIAAETALGVKGYLTPTVLHAYMRTRSVASYATVAALLAASDTFTEADIIVASQYLYEVAASGATDHDITNAGGTKFYCLATPYVTPDQFGSPGQGNDETSYVNAAFASGKPVFLNRFYDVDNAYFPANIDGITVVGGGSTTTGLNGTNAASAAILQTFEPASAADSALHWMHNFGVKGVGEIGLALAQVTNSVVSHINMSNYSGPTSVVVEESFSNNISNLRCGASTDVDIRVNKTCLNNIFTLIYTNNTLCEHHLVVDQLRNDIAIIDRAGHGGNEYNTITMQGSTSYAIKLESATKEAFKNVYFEAVEGSLLVLDCDYFQFTDTTFDADNANHSMWIGQNKGAVTYNGHFVNCTSTEKIVIDFGVEHVSCINGGGDGFKPANYILANSTYSITGTAGSLNGSGGTQLDVYGYRDSTIKSHIAMTLASGGQMARAYINASGVWTVEAPFSLPSTTQGPHSPVVTYAGSSAPAWTNGVAITPITARCVGGATPYTWSHTGTLPTGVSVNASTGEVSGTPTQTGSFPFYLKVTDNNSRVALARVCTPVVS